MRSNEDWRNDPERRAAAQRLVDLELATLDAVCPSLEEIAQKLGHLRLFLDEKGHGQQYVDALQFVYTARARIDFLHDFLPTIGETYIGNLAAFGVGMTEDGTPV